MMNIFDSCVVQYKQNMTDENALHRYFLCVVYLYYSRQHFKIIKYKYLIITVII